MASFAPPIFRDGFVYHGQLFADVGNLNRHPRASEAELTALLRPKKPAKDTSQKDQVGHWYAAQLKHYGLPQTKDKNAAKIRLLATLNSGKLEIPPDVKKLEASLKKEYDAANRKAKAEFRSKAPESHAETTTPAKKRKRDGEDDTGPAATSSTSKKTKETEPTRKKTSTATKTPGTTAASRRKTTAASTPKKPALTSMKGIYYLTVPVVAAEWPALAATPKSLKILLCPDGDKLWGSYTFGPFSGVLLYDAAQQGETYRFVWRGTDTSDLTRLKFATGCGDMRFVDTKQIEGTFYNLYGYRTTFQGKVQGGARQCPRDALSFKHEWDDYAQTNNWFGRPGINVPAGERLPLGNFAKNPALSALKPAEPRYLPVDDPQDTPSTLAEDDRKDKGKKPTVKKPRAKVDLNSERKDLPATPFSNSERRTSYIRSGEDYYNNSPAGFSSGSDPTSIGQITGVYDVQCPTIEDTFLESQNNLKLLLCRDAGLSKTWGGFAWGSFFGIIQMDPGPASYSASSVSLGWRVRDEETGDIRFGRGCNGEMEFPEPGAIQGRFFDLYGEVMEFWGRRRPGPMSCGHAPNQFKEEWDSYPSEVYGQQRGSGSDEGELYDRNGNLNPRGCYVELLKRTLRSL